MSVGLCTLHDYLSCIYHVYGLRDFTNIIIKYEYYLLDSERSRTPVYGLFISIYHSAGKHDRGPLFFTLFSFRLIRSRLTGSI